MGVLGGGVKSGVYEAAIGVWSWETRLKPELGVPDAADEGWVTYSTFLLIFLPGN